MGEIKTDLFPGNLRAGKKSRNNSGNGDEKEKRASFRNVVISVEELAGVMNEESNMSKEIKRKLY